MTDTSSSKTRAPSDQVSAAQNQTPAAPHQALAAPCLAVYEEKRSTFTALLQPISNREQAMHELEAIRRKHPGASHYCWAYLLGSADQPRSQAFNDDGEPSGTAGRPILHVLTQRSAGDCLAVVVRTFGGIKLGAGGLVRAYGASVSQALDLAHWQTVTPTEDFQLCVGFAHEERIRHLLEQHRYTIMSVDYNQDVTLQVTVPQAEADRLSQEVQHLTSGQFTFRPGKRF